MYHEKFYADRTFWIYFIITLVFIIIGASLILSSYIDNMLIILVIWIFSILFLMMTVYHLEIHACTMFDKIYLNTFFRKSVV